MQGNFSFSTILNRSLLAIIGIVFVGLVSCSEDNAQMVAQEAKKLTPEQEFQGLLKRAESGDAGAQFEVGRTIFHGRGVAKNEVEAKEWWEKAAGQGYAAAERNLGKVYYNGDANVKVDYKEAAKWFQKAAAKNDPNAMFVIGWMYANGHGVEKDRGQVAVWYQKAAALNDEDAQYYLGEMHFEGFAVEKDLAKAVELFKKSAASGYSSAQLRLGHLYANGIGVPKDSAKAVEWWEKAAIQGDVGAQANLGWAYGTWEGVSKDLVLAYAWSNLAARDSNQEVAIRNRNLYEAQLSPIAKGEAQRLSSNWKEGEALAREGKSRSLASGENSSAVPTKQSTGTAFLVSKEGHAITNHHVIDGCREVRIEGREGGAKVLSSDMVNDLALIQIPGKFSSIAAIASDPAKLRQGEDIAVFGFPLNTLLSSGGNFTPGVVSALTGIGNNTNQIQITASIQPGSSGSPVLNKKGEVVGVVSVKLSDTKMAKATGSIGQNVNFAVGGQTLTSFLESQKVEFRKGGWGFLDKSTADLADEGRKWTTVVECWK